VLVRNVFAVDAHQVQLDLIALIAHRGIASIIVDAKLEATGATAGRRSASA
jgi:hypothetical protein